MAHKIKMEIRNPSLDDRVLTVKTACGGKLDDASGYPTAMFNGETVYFCSNACLNAFLKAPVVFMAGEIEHPVEGAVNQTSMNRRP